MLVQKYKCYFGHDADEMDQEIKGIRSGVKDTFGTGLQNPLGKLVSDATIRG